MALAASLQSVLESLPDDWSSLELDLRIADERRYVEACALLTVCGAQPYSQHDWHWRIALAHRFGNAASTDAAISAFQTLDESGIAGEFEVTGVRSGLVPVSHGWGRPESVRREFRRIHAQ
ncbi:MAG: hypothetical protein V9E83_00300 [Baekduia sp.]